MGALSVILVTRLIGSDLDAVFETADLQKEADVFFMNSEYLNTDTEPIAEAIAKSNTDIVALVELNSRLSEQIRTSGRYPYAYYYPDLVFSFGFFSREPILEQQTYFVGRYPIGVFRTTERTYYVVHPLPPFGTAAWERQREFFSTLSALIGRTPNFLVLGDFNSTIYSSLFRAYFEPYFHRSVYSWGTDGPLAIPIDHALSDTAIALRSGPKLSSDHVPLLVDTN
ncbi:MAG TPA: hypothetical protein PK765_01365 [bacterium]|nr:hypothetical protein [bacterium]